MSTTLRGIEQGRASFAYNCAYANIAMQPFQHENINIDFSALFITAFKKKFKKKLNEKNEKLLKEFFEAPSAKSEDWKEEKNSFKADILEYYHKYGKEYKSYAKKIPMLVKTNGLGATYAFIKSKGKGEGTPYDLLYVQTTKWLEISESPFITIKPNQELVNALINLNSNNYRAVTNEVLALFMWIRRFAEGLIDGDDTDN